MMKAVWFSILYNGSGSSVSNNINVVTEFFQCNNNTVWAMISIFKSVVDIVDNYVDKIYILDDLLNIGNIEDLLFIRDTRYTLFKYNKINDLLEFFSTW